MKFITGGCGYLGIALAKKLKELGYKVRVYDLVKSSKLPDDIEFIQGDVCDYNKLKQATKDVDIIYHLAAIIPQRRKKEDIMTEVNVGGTKNVLSCAIENNVRKIVYTSSVQVYGRFEGIPKEDAPKNPIGCYAKNKLMSEKLCLEYFEKYNLDITILRPPTIIGPQIDEKYTLKMLSIIKSNGILPIIGDGKQKFNSIHISDCVDAIILASKNENARGETFNIGCEDVIPYIELIEKLKKRFNSKVKVLKLNKFLIVNFLRFLDFLKISPIERVYIETSPYSNVMDVSKIKEKLGFVCKINYIDAWYDMYNWYIKNETDMPTLSAQSIEQ